MTNKKHHWFYDYVLLFPFHFIYSVKIIWSIYFILIAQFAFYISNIYGIRVNNIQIHHFYSFEDKSRLNTQYINTVLSHIEMCISSKLDIRLCLVNNSYIIARKIFFLTLQSNVYIVFSVFFLMIWYVQWKKIACFCSAKSHQKEHATMLYCFLVYILI